MIEHVWTVLCEQVLSNPKTGDLSFINSLNAVPVSSVSEENGHITLVPFVLSTKWYKTEISPENLTVRVAFKKIGEEKIRAFGEEEIPFEENTVFAGLNFDVVKMIVPSEGDYLFFVAGKTGRQRKWREVATIPFKVQVPKSKKEKL